MLNFKIDHRRYHKGNQKIFKAIIIKIVYIETYKI